MTSASQEFEAYAYFSTRVDRFFNAANIYGMHHNALKHAYQRIPERDVVKEALRDDRTDERFRHFATTVVNSLNYMATTGIFSDEADEIPGQIPDDIVNFAFYTCFAFQWTLFESFVKTSMRRLIDARALPLHVSQSLEAKWYRTKQFLDYIESGAVLGHSPFTTVLPVAGWVPATETCEYRDLDMIRDLRNSFIHGLSAPEITSDVAMAKYKLYERSMWILRQFASNIDQEVTRIIV